MTFTARPAFWQPKLGSDSPENREEPASREKPPSNGHERNLPMWTALCKAPSLTQCRGPTSHREQTRQQPRANKGRAFFSKVMMSTRAFSTAQNEDAHNFYSTRSLDADSSRGYCAAPWPLVRGGGGGALAPQAAGWPGARSQLHRPHPHILLARLGPPGGSL